MALQARAAALAELVDRDGAPAAAPPKPTVKATVDREELAPPAE